MPSQTGRRRRDHSPFPPIVVVLDGKQRQKEEEERCASEAAGDGPTFAKWNPSARAPVAQSLTQMWSNPSSAISLMSPFSSLLPPFFRRRRSDSCDDIDRIAPPSSLPSPSPTKMPPPQEEGSVPGAAEKTQERKGGGRNGQTFARRESLRHHPISHSQFPSPPPLRTQAEKEGEGEEDSATVGGKKTLVLSPSPGKTRMLYLRRRPHLL